MCTQAERDAVSKLAGAAEEEAARLKKKLQESAEELEEAMRKHLADQQRIQVFHSPVQGVYCSSEWESLIDAPVPHVKVDPSLSGPCQKFPFWGQRAQYSSLHVGSKCHTSATCLCSHVDVLVASGIFSSDESWRCGCLTLSTHTGSQEMHHVIAAKNSFRSCKAKFNFYYVEQSEVECHEF